MRVLLLLGLLSAASRAAVSDVQVLGASNVQAVINFAAPPDSSCQIEVSENSDYAALVNDVNPSLFPGSDSDRRSGNLLDGQMRTVIVGNRSVDQAADQKWYSRALQADTPHYFRIACGTDIATGSFRTANLPVGITYPWPIPQDPATGNFRWPTTDNNNRAQTVIDPNYGTQIRRVSVPGDIPGVSFTGQTFAAATGTGWDSPQASLKDDNQSATYSGTGKDWLILTDPGLALTATYESVQSVDYIRVNVKGSASGSTPDTRTVEICLTIDGLTCHGNTRTFTMDSTQSTKSIGTVASVDTWGDVLWSYDVSSRLTKTFGVMIRPSQPGASISIQAVTLDAAFSEIAGMPTAGSFRTCAPQKSNGGFHCSYPGAGGAGANDIYWINPDSGETRFLGRVIATDWGGPLAICLAYDALWDSSDPNVYYCIAGDSQGNQILLKGTYTGNDNQAQPGAFIQMQWVNMTPSPHTFGALISAFNPDFKPADFGNCVISLLTNNYVILKCLKGAQDSSGWIAAFDLGNRQPVGSGGTGKIVAAAKIYAAPASRWCGIHSLEPLTGINWTGMTPSFLRDDSGALMHRTKLASALPASDGQLTIQVSGEPAPYLMDAAPGDFFQVGSGSDLLRIVKKNSSTEWVVNRTVSGGAPTAQPVGTNLGAYCQTWAISPNYSPTVYWSFLGDPQGMDATGQYVAVELILTGDHIVQRGNYRLQEFWQDGFEIVTPGAPKSWNQPITYTIPSNPKWSDQRVWLGLSEPYVGLEGYQTHPSYENYLAPDPGRANWFIDMLPFVGSNKIHGAVSAVPGTQQLYTVPNAALHPGVFPTFAVCGGRQLKNISPGPISDMDVNTFCLGSQCLAGAAQTTVVVNCPLPVNPKSTCTETYDGDDSNVCVSELPPYGQAVSQFFFDPSGKRNRVLTNGLMAWHSPRAFMTLDTASALPDGSWIVFPSFGNNARRDLYMVKVPAQPVFDPDPATGSEMASVTLSISAPDNPAIQSVALQYGGNNQVGASTPPQSCAAGTVCAVTIAAHPMELVYAQPVYLDASQNQVGTGSWMATIAGSQVIKPQIAVSEIVNGASFQPQLAPGGLVTITGANLSGCDGTLANAPPLPAVLCNTQVLFNGIPGPIYFAGKTQVSAFVPNSIPPGQDIRVTVVNAALQESTEVVFPGAAVLSSAPAIFSFTLNDSIPRAVIQSSDGSMIGPQDGSGGMRPLRTGEAALLYANSLGATDPVVAGGQPAPGNPPARAVQPVQVFVNDFPQHVSFAELVPQSAGLYQVNFELNPDTPLQSDGSDAIKLNVNGVDSPSLRISIAAQ